MSGEQHDPAPAAPPSLQMLGGTAPACEDGVCAVPDDAAPAAEDDAQEA